MRRMKIDFYKKGQSLVELIIAFFVMALVVVAIVGLSTKSVRNSSFARDNSLARKYAEEGMEWVRNKRNEDWSTLYGKGGSDSFNIYCLNSFPGTWHSGNCSDYISNTIFARELGLRKNEDNALDIYVSVDWEDSQGDHEVKLETKLYNLE